MERISPQQERYRLVTISDRAVLDGLFTCYRATPTQVECSMKNPFVKAMTVAEVSRRIREFAPANRAVFLDYVERFQAQPNGIEMTIPAYGLGPNGYLLLDGNHRATAAAMSERPFAITLSVLDGPVDRRILRDLKFWDGGIRRFARRWRQAA